MEGGRVQQSVVGLGSSARSSISRKSCGRSSTHTLSSLSTARPVTPPIFQLFGKGLGHSGSNLYFGADCACAPSAAHKTNKQMPANPMNARQRTLQLLFISPLLKTCCVTQVGNPNCAESSPSASACQPIPPALRSHRKRAESSPQIC